MNNAEQTEDPVLSLIKITLPNNESFDLQVHPLGIVKDIYLILMEREETCHRTCFSLKLNNMADYLDELKPIRELKNDVVFVVEELYNEREAKFHIKHIHDLLRYVELTDAYLGRNHKSLSFVNIITEGFLLESKYQQTSDSLDSEPPEYILPLRNNSVNDLQLTHLHPIEIEIKPNICLQSLNYSYWNPPSSDRVLHGDLVYLYVHTREDKRIHITGCPKGFYVNQSTDESFNPEKEGLLFHSIIDLLKNVSSLFNQNYVSLIKRRSNRHAFERIKTPYQIYSWLSPIFEHNLDSIRKKEEFCSKITFEEYPPAETRDWNNEMQNSRELPRENKFDRVNREKLIFKTNIDFVTVATRGAMSILRGNIMAIDPRKCKKQQSFYWNNIFFELGFDNDDYYRDMGGDPAAYAAIMHHFNKTCFYYSLDIPGLCTLDTVVIDFAGYRVKATPMNIIPKEQADNGIVFASPYLTNIDRYLEYPEIISDELNIDVYSFCCKYKVSRITLLRNFCQCLGIQLLLRDYTFDQKNKQTFNNEDIMNIYPVVKHLNPHASDAHELISLGQLNLLQGNVFEGREFLKKALNLFNQVYGPLHPDTASCNRSLARSSYKLGDYQAAIKYQHKSTMISERVHGVDSSIIISEYYYLGKYSYKCNRFNVALNCMYRARYVALLCHGKNHPEMTKIDLNIGKMLVAVKNYDKATKFLLSARQTANLFKENEKKITSCYMWIARVYGYIGRFHEAIMYESMCCFFYIKNFGLEHVRTKDSKTHIEFLENQLKKSKE